MSHSKIPRNNYPWKELRVHLLLVSFWGSWQWLTHSTSHTVTDRLLRKNKHESARRWPILVYNRYTTNIARKNTTSTPVMVFQRYSGWAVPTIQWLTIQWLGSSNNTMVGGNSSGRNVFTKKLLPLSGLFRQKKRGGEADRQWEMLNLTYAR